jgi:Leucine-rich repeat (LRR) protein
LTNLRFLALGSNRITKIERLLALEKLEVLDLADNQIAELDARTGSAGIVERSEFDP